MLFTPKLVLSISVHVEGLKTMEKSKHKVERNFCLDWEIKIRKNFLVVRLKH